jgi:N-acetylglutamate synthase-like GNAT family acetyltransferase
VFSVRELLQSDIPECDRILRALPQWFGIEASNRMYIENLEKFSAAVAEIEGNVLGFVALEHHNPTSVEVHVMAVDPAHHRAGIGGGLLRWAEARCKEQRVRWLHVKTRGPSTPDPFYDRTRGFYRSHGFEPLFESRTLWGESDAALILVKSLRVEQAAQQGDEADQP